MDEAVQVIARLTAAERTLVTAESCTGGLLGADYALSVTGNAGPGADEKNPRVGEIFVACADAAGTRCVRLECGGTRAENREAACRAALRLLLECIA